MSTVSFGRHLSEYNLSLSPSPPHESSSRAWRYRPHAAADSQGRGEEKGPTQGEGRMSTIYSGDAYLSTTLSLSPPHESSSRTWQQGMLKLEGDVQVTTGRAPQEQEICVK